MEIGESPEHSRRRQGIKKESSEESSFFLQLCFAKRLLTDLGESRGQSLASTWRRFGNRRCECDGSAVSRSYLNLPATSRMGAVIQVYIRHSFPRICSGFLCRSARSDCASISKVRGNAICTRSRVTDKSPAASSIRFSGISLLQLHVGLRLKSPGID